VDPQHGGRLATAIGLIVCLLVLPAPTDARQDARSWVMDWLQEYAGGAHDAVAARLQTIADVKTFEKDLDRLSKPWVEERGADTLARRRQLAAFALEAAYAKLTAGEAAANLLEFGCRQVRRIPRASVGAFERYFHLAAFAVMAGAVDPDGMESHLTHMRLQFPDEPRLAFERAIAAELRAAPFFEEGRASPEEVRKRLETAAKLFRTAAREPSVMAESQVRLGRIELQLGRPNEAIAAIQAIGAAVEDRFVAYLANLFRGQALDQLGRLEEARRQFEGALTVIPGAQSGMLALASVQFRLGQRTEADATISTLLTRTAAPLDPWWVYGPADYRHVAGLVPAMREALK
jgi:tetratricopeptide (TPR) repeat protein